jgi:hypothetical protein
MLRLFQRRAGAALAQSAKLGVGACLRIVMPRTPLYNWTALRNCRHLASKSRPSPTSNAAPRPKLALLLDAGSIVDDVALDCIVQDVAKLGRLTVRKA